jgi:hypothetical protein
MDEGDVCYGRARLERWGITCRYRDYESARRGERVVFQVRQGRRLD